MTKIAALLIEGKIRSCSCSHYQSSLLLYELTECLETRSFGKALLQHMVIQRFYLFPADYKLKQRVCAKLGIPYKPIQSMDPGKKLIAPPEDQ